MRKAVVVTVHKKKKQGTLANQCALRTQICFVEVYVYFMNNISW